MKTIPFTIGVSTLLAMLCLSAHAQSAKQDLDAAIRKLREAGEKYHPPRETKGDAVEGAIKGEYEPPGEPTGDEIKRAISGEIEQFGLLDHEKRDDCSVPTGPVWLAPTAALIAPRKSSGLPWDGMGGALYPNESGQALAAQLPKSAIRRIGRELGLGGGSLALVTGLLPWTAYAYNRGMAAPDVVLQLSVRGTPIVVTPKVNNSHTPVWASAYSPALTIDADTPIEIAAWDLDFGFHDNIGICTMKGMPCVDRHGYAVPESFTCFSQLWTVNLRVMPARN